MSKHSSDIEIRWWLLIELSVEVLTANEEN